VADASREIGTLRVKTGLAEMLKGGVIMDVVTAEHAKIRRGCRCGRRHGPGARAGRYSAQRAAWPACPTRRWVEAIVSSVRSGHGEVPHRPLRGGSGPASRWALTYNRRV